MADKKCILVNAATAAIGGGMLVAIDIIKAICRNDNFSVILVCPPVNVYKKLDVKANKIYVPSVFLKIYSRWWLDFFWLRKKIKIISPDLVITLGNLPAVCSRRQIMFNDNAFVSEKNLSGFSLTFKERMVHLARKYFFIRRLKYVDTLVVQSNLEKRKFESAFKKLPEIKILSPLFPSHLLADDDVKIEPPVKGGYKYRIGCISYVHGHKNIGILCNVLELARQANFPLQIIFTISPARSTISRKLKKQLYPFLESGSAINLGKIKATQLPALLDQIDGVILPSLNESFSLNFIEALNFHKHLFVSDRNFSREICKENAWYFNPTNAENIFNTIQQVFSSEAEKQKPSKVISVSEFIGKELELFNIINELIL